MQRFFLNKFMNKEAQLLVITDAVFLFGSGLFGPIYAIFVAKVGGDILDAGVAYAIFLIAMATLEYPIGKLMDKYGKKYFLFAGYLIAALAIFGYIFVDNIWQLFILQIIMGLAFALSDPAWDAWFSDIIPQEKSGFDWSIYHMFAGYGAGLSALAGGIIAKFLGFPTLFGIGGIITLICALAILSIKSPANVTEKTSFLHIYHRRHFPQRRKNYHKVID